MADAIREMCFCNFTLSDLEESEATCSTNDNTTMTFTTTVLYSTESGNMTALTLIHMFQERAASTSTVISVGSQTATIVSVCNPYCTTEPQPSPCNVYTRVTRSDGNTNLKCSCTCGSILGRACYWYDYHHHSSIHCLVSLHDSEIVH